MSRRRYNQAEGVRRYVVGAEGVAVIARALGTRPGEVLRLLVAQGVCEILAIADVRLRTLASVPFRRGVEQRGHSEAWERDPRLRDIGRPARRYPTR